MRCHRGMTTETEGGTALVPGAHRTIRVLGADEGPFRGALVTAGEAVAVMTDADDLSGWAGWSYAGSDHVAGPLDLVRRADGHGVLLPWCTETVDAFLGRRAAIGAPLTAGEASTLVVSLIRGVGEVVDEGDHGCWWLTDGGRPVFVIGEGDDVRDAAAAVVDRVHREGSDRALGRLLAAVRDGLRDGRDRPRMSPMQLERWEAELFEIAAPRALDTAMHAPERVRGIEMLREGGIRPPTTRRASRSSARQGVFGARLRPAVADAAERVHRAGSALSARFRRRERDLARTASGTASPPPRRKIMIAGACAVVVIAGGLLWPGGATGEAASSAAPSRSPASDEGPNPTGSSANPNADDPAESPRPPDPQGTSDDPVVAATALLEEIASCADRGDTTCEGAVASGAAGIVDALGEASESGAPATELVDAYGDIAVIRLSPASGTAEETAGELMLVLVRLAEKWLVRDVYGVADQPG
ncbi:hypothetical protein QFZ53_002629 [Microbacterium natoriense]|uniref:Uncharacterized protein n=2 Tax=Microbacterium natoriense TaxID=284570 RepID=A0AAW8EY55_9MICO|nr:hypothetical protein [Microbacterium natoriense]